jgi:hypothetical protein
METEKGDVQYVFLKEVFKQEVQCALLKKCSSKTYLQNLARVRRKEKKIKKQNEIFYREVRVGWLWYKSHCING